MNRILITTLAGVFFFTMAPTLCAQTAPDGNTPDWQSMSPTELLLAAKNLTGNDPAVVAGRQSLAGNVAARFLADANATRSIPCVQWGEFAKSLSGSLTAEQRGLWIARIRAAYLQDAAGLAALKTVMNIRYTIGALRELGDRQPCDVAAAFTLGTTAWQSWGPRGLIGLSQSLARLGKAGGAEARQAIVAFVAAKYVRAESVKSMTLAQWNDLVKALGPYMSQETKAEWSSTIVQAFAGNAESAGVLTAGDVSGLVALLGKLAAGNPAVDPDTAIRLESATWQKWDPNSQCWLIGLLAAPDRREATKPARLKILEHITAICMPTNEEAKKVLPKQWASLVMGLHDVMPEETSTLWAERLRGVFDSAALANLGADAKQRRALLPIVAILDAKMKTGLALNWLKDKTLWQGAPIEALTSLAMAAYRDNRDETLPVLTDLDKFCVARHATQPLTLDECLALRGMYLKVGQVPKAQLWVLVGCDRTIGTEALRAAADQSTVVKLSLALVDTALVGPDKDCSKFAATVAAVAAKGGLDFRLAWQPKCVGEALGTPAGRQIVRDALLDAAGNPRLEVAKILATAYKTHGDFKPWQGYVGQQLSVAPAGKDRKALWHLVQGYTKSVAPKTDDMLQIRPGVTAALANAETDRVRITAWQELANMYIGINRPGVASRMLESVKGQFTGDELASIEALQKDLEKKEAARLSRSGPR